MGASPFWKVYNAHGEYRASFVDASEAAAFVSVLGAMATIRAGHRHIVWRERDDVRAGYSCSYDVAGAICEQRFRDRVYHPKAGRARKARS